MERKKNNNKENQTAQKKRDDAPVAPKKKSKGPSFFETLEKIYNTARIIAFVVLFFLFLIYFRYGGNKFGAFPNLSTKPLLNETVLEVIAELEASPGNIAVTSAGRIFFTIHPEAFSLRSEKVANYKLVELGPKEEGQRFNSLIPFPSADFQNKLISPLAVRLDRQNRLWVLDFSHHAVFSSAKLFAIDLATEKVVHEVHFGVDIAPFASMMNDFQVDPEGKKIYIADASFFGKRPALIVYDIATKKAKRFLEGHKSVTEKPYQVLIKSTGREMTFLGVVACRPGVDSIVLDRRGENLYFASVTDSVLYRIHTKHLLKAFDQSNSNEEELISHIEVFANKTMSDGLTIDNSDNIYLSDMENSAIHLLHPNKTITTLVQSESLLRWPDGFSFGGVGGAGVGSESGNTKKPVGHLYVTCSALHEVIFTSTSHAQSKAPYHILRLKANGQVALAGH
eukprot:TRINITY_DN3427_c0_g1_i1.p1 TRINITY_DN3427_c0_g1~~TRINITY_DN3427_c0_g1_i1.p1  ORF type:complete len:460 (+),score=181.63 TRINITY_DN3427_c0_g1_i1:23-1381(+)